MYLKRASTRTYLKGIVLAHAVGAPVCDDGAEDGPQLLAGLVAAEVGGDRDGGQNDADGKHAQIQGVEKVGHLCFGGSRKVPRLRRSRDLYRQERSRELPKREQSVINMKNKQRTAKTRREQRYTKISA